MFKGSISAQEPVCCSSQEPLDLEILRLASLLLLKAKNCTWVGGRHQQLLL